MIRRKRRVQTGNLEESKQEERKEEEPKKKRGKVPPGMRYMPGGSGGGGQYITEELRKEQETNKPDLTPNVNVITHPKDIDMLLMSDTDTDKDSTKDRDSNVSKILHSLKVETSLETEFPVPQIALQIPVLTHSCSLGSEQLDWLVDHVDEIIDTRTTGNENENGNNSAIAALFQYQNSFANSTTGS